MFGCCSERKGPIAAATTENKPTGAGGQVGVGIVFQPDVSGALHVKSLAIGGPADKSGLVQVGDELHEIDGVNVYRRPVGELAPLILGAPGTSVKLGFKRGDKPSLVYVELRRGWSLDSNAVGPKTWSHPLPEHAKLSHFAKDQ